MLQITPFFIFDFWFAFVKLN